MSIVAGQHRTREERARRRTASAVAASVLAHAALFAAAGLYAPRLRFQEPPPLATTDIWILPREARSSPVARAPSRPAPAKALASKAPPPSPPAPRAPAQRSARSPTVQPLPPGLAPTSRPPAEAPAEPTGETGGGVREALRTSVGCSVEDYDEVVRLTPGEKDHCHQAAGAAARNTPAFSGLELAKEGRFAAQAESDARRRDSRRGPVPDLVVRCGDDPNSTAQGANLGAGCLPPSAIMNAPRN